MFRDSEKEKSDQQDETRLETHEQKRRRENIGAELGLSCPSAACNQSN